VRCAELNLPSTYYCGEECMNAHWHNGHKEYHRKQTQRLKQIRELGQLDHGLSLAEAQARQAEATGSEFDKRTAAAMALSAEGDYHAAAKAWRRLIKEVPALPEPYFHLAAVLDQSDRDVEAAPMYLKAMELSEEGTERWAKAAATAFDLLKASECDEVPKPEWWNDEALKALSARVVALVPDRFSPCSMRAYVLAGDAFWETPWNVGPRTAAEIKEAATLFRRAARTCRVPATEQRYEGMAHECDEIADPLLAKEEAEATAARAAAEAEAAQACAAAKAEEAEAMKVAEAKAVAAAEELLAEEMKEKQQAAKKTASKAKQGKGNLGKKGKGRR